MPFSFNRRLVADQKRALPTPAVRPVAPQALTEGSLKAQQSRPPSASAARGTWQWASGPVLPVAGTGTCTVVPLPSVQSRHATQCHSVSDAAARPPAVLPVDEVP